jgi:CRP-like cAMP-binding protein
VVKHVHPEEKIINQSDEIKLPNSDQYDEETAYFYIILSGIFKVSAFSFNKKKKVAAGTNKDDKNFKEMLNG